MFFIFFEISLAEDNKKENIKNDTLVRPKNEQNEGLLFIYAD